MPETDVHISVVIPCLNEEAAIGAVIDQAWVGIDLSEMTGEVVVVDNASTDRSAEIAAAHGARVVHEPRRGYGSAYLAGLEATRGTYVVMADADGSYDLTTIPSFVARLEAGADIVMGSRFRGRIAPGAMPALHRYIGNPLLTGFLNMLFRTGVSDAHCGLRALRRDALPRLQLQTLGMEFASEMVVKAAKRQLTIAEVPIGYAPRVGNSKLNSFRDGWRHLRFLLVHSPTFLFLLPGAILLVAGLAIVLPLASGPIHVLGRTWQIHTMIVGCTAVLVGAQVVQLGLFARTYAILYLNETDAALERAWRRVRLEHGLLLGVLLIAGGIVTLGSVIGHWASNGFGELAASHPSLFGLMLLGLGVQVFFGSFFLSILGLRKQLLLGERPVADVGEGAAGACTKQPVGPR